MKDVYTAKGLPELDMSGKQTSFFEFWPMWLMYLPVVLQWIVLSIYYRSLTLPLIANPKLPLSGMVGVGKSELLATAHGHCDDAILPWFIYQKTQESIENQVNAIKQRMAEKKLTLPLVCKPDIGCRGSGVTLVKDDNALAEYLRKFPANANIVVQKLADYEPEAGVFYVRMPNQSKGEIISLAIKYTPYLVGDGKHTLLQLMEQDPRVKELMHLYTNRLQDSLNTVLEKDEVFRLVFSASHCRGAIFRDGNQFITQALTDSLDVIMKDLPDFYYGRLDVKFANVEALQNGETLQIIEINSASSEPLHIWDRNTPFLMAIKALLRQYRLLFTIGNINRQRGFKPPSIKSLLNAWRYEKSLVNDYPQNN